jgi:hypothetical protein
VVTVHRSGSIVDHNDGGDNAEGRGTSTTITGEHGRGARAAVPCGDGPMDLRLTSATKSSRTAPPLQQSWAPSRWWGGRLGGRSVASDGDDFRSSGHQCD